MSSFDKPKLELVERNLALGKTYKQKETIGEARFGASKNKLKKMDSHLRGNDKKEKQ